MNILKLTQILTILLTLAAAIPVSAETHVFWYKALQNHYALTDSLGPALPADAIVHEGKIVTCNVSVGLGYAGRGFSCGSGWTDDQGWCSAFFSGDLSDSANAGSSVTSAFLRGEYDDWAFSSPQCNEGPIAIRCGVIDVSFGVSMWDKPSNLPDDAVWADLDPMNTLNYNYPIAGAEEILNFTALGGRRDGMAAPVLDSQFVSIDVTDQVNWILANYAAGTYYAIVVLSKVGTGSTGKFSTLANEQCVYDPTHNRMVMVPNAPWAADGNSIHLVINGDLADSVRAEKPPAITEQALGVSVYPNPFNPSTTISYSIPGNGRAMLSIFSFSGQCVFQKQVAGSGSFSWDASKQGSGVYVCRLEAGGKVVARRMVFIR